MFHDQAITGILKAIREHESAADQEAAYRIHRAEGEEIAISGNVALHVNLDKTAELRKETFTA